MDAFNERTNAYKKKSSNSPTRPNVHTMTNPSTFNFRKQTYI